MNKISQPKVTIYYNEHCHPCHACMEWMGQEGIEYEAIDVVEARAKGECDIWCVPTIIVGDTKIRGFRRDLIKEALGLA